jgi:hypothetical protein
MILSFRKTLFKAGAASIEGLLSIMLLIICLWVMWGVAISLFNQGVLNSAGLLSSQAGLLEYSRNTYQTYNNTGLRSNAENRATRSAYSVFMVNSCNMLTSQAGSNSNASRCQSSSYGVTEVTPASAINNNPSAATNYFRLQFRCGNLAGTGSTTSGESKLSNVRSLSAAAEVANQTRAGMNSLNCGSRNGAEVLATTVTARISSPFSILSGSEGEITQNIDTSSYLFRPVRTP